MATFQDIIGQEKIVEHLKAAVETGNVNHAYILQGERSCGKEFIARIFAKALQCDNPQNGEPCCECQSCKQADSGNQPDIIRVTHEKPNTIGVEDIRKITGDVAIKPYSSKRKIYIINEAEKMTVQAQNALLKTLEEPPAYVVILLLTTNVDALLQTIQSRCVLLTMKPVRDELVKQYLMRDVQVPDYKADVCVAFARGNVGRAKHWLPVKSLTTSNRTQLPC